MFTHRTPRHPTALLYRYSPLLRYTTTFTNLHHTRYTLVGLVLIANQFSWFYHRYHHGSDSPYTSRIVLLPYQFTFYSSTLVFQFSYCAQYVLDLPTLQFLLSPFYCFCGICADYLRNGCASAGLLRCVPATCCKPCCLITCLVYS